MTKPKRQKRCYFCKNPTVKRNDYYGCVHTVGRKVIHVRHIHHSSGKLKQLAWSFKHKRRTYQMVYWWLVCGDYWVWLERLKGKERQTVFQLSFIPEWTPENCHEKIEKLLAFA